jgi:hypothetical protein
MIILPAIITIVNFHNITERTADSVEFGTGLDHGTCRPRYDRDWVYILLKAVTSL